jgi:hypothetical protein
MGFRQQLTLPASAYYAPVPMLTVDREQWVVDYNLALQVLLAGTADGWRDRPVRRVVEELGPPRRSRT